MNAPAPLPPRGEERDAFFLPDFCAAPAVLAIVLIAALLGFVLALARQSAHGAFWTDLARTSGFLLWAGLLCAGALCQARPWLARKPLHPAIGWSLAIMVGTVALLSEAVYLLGAFWADRIGAPSALFPSSQAGFVLPNVLIAAIVGALALRYFYVTQQWRRSVELQARARINALQARIRPHFLFNSMNTIAALTRSDPARAEEAIEDLADLFRASLAEARAQITLQDELDIARIYQRIEQLRLGARLQVQWDVATLPPGAVVPSLLLQPLLENAIGHGIETLPEGGTVIVRGRVDGNDLVLEVANPLRRDRPSLPRQGNRMALDNIRERLELAFPGRSAVEINEGETSFCVRLRFPRLGDDARADAGAPGTGTAPSR
ncbi:MAG TPA: histidine kinase [Steroidobacteraceae bacterium]